MSSSNTCTCISLSSQHVLHLLAGKLGEAEALCRNTLEAMAQELGDGHKITQEAMGDLAKFLEQQGKP